MHSAADTYKTQTTYDARDFARNNSNSRARSRHTQSTKTRLTTTSLVREFGFLAGHRQHRRHPWSNMFFVVVLVGRKHPVRTTKNTTPSLRTARDRAKKKRTRSDLTKRPTTRSHTRAKPWPMRALARPLANVKPVFRRTNVCSSRSRAPFRVSRVRV